MWEPGSVGPVFLVASRDSLAVLTDQCPSSGTGVPGSHCAKKLSYQCPFSLPLSTVHFVLSSGVSPLAS